MKRLTVPLLVVIFGACWLLAELQFVDVGRMLWTVGLFVSGVLFLTHLGFSKSTFVIGSMLIIGSGLSVLRYAGHLTIDREMPILIIILGVLMAINTTRLIPADRTPSDDPPADA